MIEESRSSETDETVGPGIVADLHRRYKSEAAYIKNYLNGGKLSQFKVLVNHKNKIINK